MTDIKDFDPRKYMKLAIHQMKQSVNEPRDDGKASPSVGVVLIKRDGKFEFAHRGELRHGDHAEYTLLERKNQQTALDGSILFSTLEPCAPGARSERKLSCAERIVLARIKEVWIGLEDPDPKVDRKGIEFLKKSGIKIHMFDRDLQEEIREANKDFFRQALERAAEEEKPEKIKLSEYEEILPSTDLKDFSGDALNSYREKINLTDAVGSAGFNRRLMQQGLLKEEKGELIPTGFGIVLFGKEPRITMPQTGLLATVLYPNGREEIENFEDPIVLIPEMLEAWLRKTLALTINRDSMERKEEIDMPFDIIRESVVNALIHRDYDIKGAKCQLYITEDTITVKSPGEPLHPITIEKLQSFEAPMLSRNPTLHYVFAQMDLAEERGLGP